MPTYPYVVPIVNPGFETGDATGWDALYGSGFVVHNINPRGAFRALCGYVQFTWAGQTIALPSDVLTDVDGGLLQADFGVYMSGGTDTDNGSPLIEFFAGDGTWLADQAIGWLDPPNQPTWARYSTSAFVPPGTRSVRISVRGERITGTELSIFVDDFDLTLTKLTKPHALIGTMFQSVDGWTNVSGGVGICPPRLWDWQGMYGPGNSPTAYRDFAIPTGALAEVDAGTAKMRTNFHIGRFNNDSDPVRVWFEAYNASGTLISTIAESSAAKTNWNQKWIPFYRDVTLPALTRTIRANYSCTAASGTNADGNFTRMSILVEAAGVLAATGRRRHSAMMVG